MIVIAVGALIIGLTLGLLGSGGSAVTVPVLIYLVGHDAKQSIAESMAIVGLISVVAAIPYARAQQIDWRSVWYFGIPGMFGTLLGAWLGGLASEALQLIVFGGVLILAAYVMLRNQGDRQAANPTGSETSGAEETAGRHRSPIWKMAMEGAAVGAVTGFVGVGGGFLIVPALVVMGQLPMRLAIGTSLVIIAVKAAVGFAKYQQYLLSHGTTVDVPTVAAFVSIGVIGSLAGKLINDRLNQRLLRRVFAVFLIVLGGLVIAREGSKFIAAPAAATTMKTSPMKTSPAKSLQPLHKSLSTTRRHRR